MTTTELLPLILLGGGAFLLIGAAVHFTGVGSLNNIKSKTVGDGQHGTARWATKQEIQKTYRHIPFRPDLWRRGEDLPTAQGRRWLELAAAFAGVPIQYEAEQIKQRETQPTLNMELGVTL